MTLPVEPALAPLLAELRTAVEARDVAKLTDFLRGRRLPALGGQLVPSEVLQQALWALNDRDLVRQLSPLLAELLTVLLADAVVGDLPDVSERTALVNAVRLAKELPIDPKLNRSLRDLLAYLAAKMSRTALEETSFGLSVWDALVYQQADSSCEEEWFSILWGLDRNEPAWSPGHRTLLIIAWRGLLWIPPDSHLREDEVIDFDRVNRGLIAISRAVAGQHEARELLGQALDILTKTFPRSPDFWERQLGLSQQVWPLELRQEVELKWPQRNLSEQIFVAWDQGDLEERLKPKKVPQINVIPMSTGPIHLNLFEPGLPWQRNLSLTQAVRLRNSFENALMGRGVETSAGFNPGGPAIGFSLSSCLIPHVKIGLLSVAESCSAIWRGGHWGVAGYSEIQRRPRMSTLKSELVSAPSPNDAMQAIEFLSRQEPYEVKPGLASLQPCLAEEVQEVVLYRRLIGLDLGGQKPAMLSLACYAPEPVSFLETLDQLSSEERTATVDQLRQRLALTWNFVERSYLGAIVTLIALKDEDFHRALQELETQVYRQTPLDVEFKVLHLHAVAGAGARRESRRLYQSLLSEPSLSGEARATLGLLDKTYGFTHAPAANPARLQKQLIDSEAGMLTGAAGPSSSLGSDASAG